MSNTVNPMIIRVEDTGEVFTLEFSREAVKFAENRGFIINEIGDLPMTKVPDLFFYAFRKNHRSVSRDRTDKLLDELKGLTKAQVYRLIELYSVPMQALIRDEDDEEAVKNSNLTVEL